MEQFTKFTHPSKRGADQQTNFVQVKYPETAGERDFPQAMTTSASRGEDNFDKIKTAK